MLTTLVANVFGGVSSGVGESGKIFTGVNGAITQFATNSNQGDSRPAAYLNYILFDLNYKVLDADHMVAHDYLTLHVDVKVKGFLYVYLSNEQPVRTNVYFDDFKMTYKKSAVVQADDYYPFGLTFNSYSRENSVPQDVKFNGKEEQNELSLGWLDYGPRMYDASLGRWNKIDRLSEKFAPLSPYTYAACNPIIYVDINGDDIYYFDEKGYYTGYMVKDDGPTVEYMVAKSLYSGIKRMII